MKNIKTILFLILIIFTTNCNNKKNETLKLSNSNLIIVNENIQSSVEQLYTEFVKCEMENPVLTKPYKDKADTLLEIFYQFYKIYTEITTKIEDKTSKEIDNPDIINYRTNYKKQELFATINQLKTYIQNTVKDSTYFNNNLKISFDFSYLENKKLTPLSLNLIFNKFIILEYQTLQHLLRQIEIPHPTWNYLKVFTIPKNKYVKKGEYMEADIFVGIIDTTKDSIIRNVRIIVENDTIKQKKGTGYFSVKAKKRGKNIFNGRFEIRKPNTDEIMEFPFKIKFYVK